MNWKRLSGLLVSLSMLLCGCSPVTPAAPAADPLPENTDARHPLSPTAPHLVDNVLHQVSVTPTDRPFVTDGSSAYSIVVGSGAENAKAAALIQQHIFQVSGVSLPVISDSSTVTYTADSRLIVLNAPEVFRQAGFVMPEVDLGLTGYVIRSVDNSVLIATASEAGAQKGAIAFLHHAIGYEMYAEDTVAYSNHAETLPDFAIAERPDFEYYYQSNYVSQEAAYGMNFSTDLFIPIAGAWCHNSLDCLPMEQYADAHPSWYSTEGNELCYTAHGDAAEWELMVQQAAERVLEAANAYPDRPFLALTIEDHDTICGCAACEQVRADYHGANSAACIRFINAVNRLVQDALAEQAKADGTEKRALRLLFFAYRQMEQPPVEWVDDHWEPMDESVVCDETVGVYLAPIAACYSHSFYDEVNTPARDVLEGWSVLTNNMCLWLYETNYTNYLFPLNSYDTMLETYRFSKQNHAVFLYPEGQHNQGNVTCFGKLKEYFNARALFSVNDSFAAIADDFFAHYFQEAAAPMRRYFDELQIHLRDLESTWPDIDGTIYNWLCDTKYWSIGTLRHWMDLLNEAYAAIEPLASENPERYQTLKKHIDLESIFPRFAICQLYGNCYTSAVLRNMREALQKDCETLSVTMFSEGRPMNEIFTEWGLAGKGLI